MASTSALIQSLSRRLMPVHRLNPPALRELAWIAFGTMLVAALTLLRGPRLDLEAQLQDRAFALKLMGAWITGATATFAAFQLSLPDRRAEWLLLPVPSTALWLYGFVSGCLADWIAIPAGAPVAAASVRCLETIVMASVPLALVLWAMLRQAMPLRPARTAWMGGLAIAGIADSAHLLIHDVEASALVLTVNLVPVVLIVAACGIAGRRTLARCVAEG